MRALLILFLVVIQANAQTDAPKGLAGYLDKNLETLKDAELVEFRQRLEKITGDKPEKEDDNRGRGFTLRWVKAFKSGEVAWMLVEGYKGYAIPDVSGVRVHLFDKDWKRIRKEVFPTGYRAFLEDVSISEKNPTTQPLLVATVSGSSYRGDTREYFGVTGDRLATVRIDSEDNLDSSYFGTRFPFQGPQIPAKTREEWIRSLDSKNPVELLATMVWLSGRHLSSKEPRKADHNQALIEDSELFESVRDAAETKKALEGLVASENAWVKEYAKFTLEAIAMKGK